MNLYAADIEMIRVEQRLVKLIFVGRDKETEHVLNRKHLMPTPANSMLSAIPNGGEERDASQVKIGLVPFSNVPTITVDATKRHAEKKILGLLHFRCSIRCKYQVKGFANRLLAQIERPILLQCK